MTPFITVVIPVRNEAKFIKDTLQQLVMQDYPKDRFEIVVVDGMSQDETRSLVMELANSYPQIILLDNPKRLSSAGRNIGFKHGRGDYFLVVDGHCFIPDNKLFVNLVECFGKSGADCLGRPQHLDPPGLTPLQRSIALARGSKFGHGGGSLIYENYEGFASPVSNGAAYNRKVFEKVGYVDENFDAAEDVEFNYRIEKAGLACYTSSKLIIKYYPRETLKGLFKQLVRYGKGRRRFTRKHPEALTINQLIPACFVIGIFVFLCTWVDLALTGAVLPLALIGIPYGIYLLILAFETLKVLLNYGGQLALPIPAILFVIHFALGFGFIQEVFGKPQETRIKGNGT